MILNSIVKDLKLQLNYFEEINDNEANECRRFYKINIFCEGILYSYVLDNIFHNSRALSDKDKSIIPLLLEKTV